MDVILLKDVEKVGLRGDVVNVAPGYARNFLLPRKLAEPASEGRVNELRRHEELRSRHEAQDVEQARGMAEKLEEGELRVDVKAGPGGVLFGSVTATTLVDELWGQRKVRVDRRKIELSEPIKRIGRYEVPVELFTDVTATLHVAVAPEGEELPPEEELQAEAEARAAAAAQEEAEAEAAHAEAEAAVAEQVVAEEAEEPAEEAAEAPEGARDEPEQAPEPPELPAAE
jgi:large subunit ribosomal protein L9